MVSAPACGDVQRKQHRRAGAKHHRQRAVDLVAHHAEDRHTAELVDPRSSEYSAGSR
jgi:hypothetical protein